MSARGDARVSAIRAKYQLLETLLSISGTAADSFAVEGSIRAAVPLSALVIALTPLHDGRIIRTLQWWRARGRSVAVAMIDTSDLLGEPASTTDAFWRMASPPDTGLELVHPDSTSTRIGPRAAVRFRADGAPRSLANGGVPLHLYAWRTYGSCRRLSENNRRAKFYRLTAAGRRELAKKMKKWTRFAQAVDRTIEAALGRG